MREQRARLELWCARRRGRAEIRLGPRVSELAADRKAFAAGPELVTQLENLLLA